MLFNIQSFHCTYNTVTYIYTWRNSPGFSSPLAGSPLSPLYIPFHLLGTLQL